MNAVAFGARFIQFEKFSGRHVENFIMKSVIPIEEKVLDMLDSPRSSDDILNELDLDDENIDLDSTLNRLHKKKKIVAYEEDKKTKFVKIEAAITAIFERLDKIEKRLDKLE